MNRLEEIFKKQRALLVSLGPVYEANGFSWHNRFPYSLDERWSQEGFRLLAWRITEEVHEALACWVNYAGKDTVDYHEEVADVLHFFVELCICAGITLEEISTGLEGSSLLADRDPLEAVFKDLVPRAGVNGATDNWNVFISSIADLMMKFRQRPWRTDNRVTDRKALVMSFAVAWYAFIEACIATGITDKSLYSAYFRKGEINDQRVVDAKAGIP